MKIYVPFQTIKKLKDEDALSTESIIFRNGGTFNGEAAIPCEVILPESRPDAKCGCFEPFQKAYPAQNGKCPACGNKRTA